MKAKEEKRAKVLMATAAAFIVVLAFSGIVSADPYCGGLSLTNVKEGEVSGDLWFEHYSPLTHNHAAESFTLPSYTDVEWAQLYVAVYCGHMEKNYAGRANITFNGAQLGGTKDGLSSEAFDVCYTYPGKEYTTPCARGSAGYNDAPGPGTGPEWVNDHCVRVTSDYLMWYNVTDLVQPNSNVVVDTWNMEGYTGTFDNRTKVITLVVAYNDGDSDTVRYWVNQGHDVDNYYWDAQGDNYIGETIFAADLPTGSTIQKSNLTVVQMASEDGTYTYNTDSIPTDPNGTTTPPGENWQKKYSGYNIWYAASQFNSNSDNTLNYDRTGGFYKIFLGLLSAEYTEEQLPDLVPTRLEVTHNYYNGAWAMLNNTVEVTVANIDSGDAGEFDVKLYAKLNDDFEEVGNETVTSLPSGNSTEASFVWTPSEAGDYSLKAVVDPDNAIAESNVTNNELIEPIDVGYNGYMGDKPLTTYAHGKIKGNISFTHGDSFYSGLVDSDGTYTVNHTVDIPDGATLKFARLYSYWTWCPDYPVMNLTFDGNTISPDRKYTDRKGWGGYYDYPTGTYGYNVTSFVTGSGSHTTVVTNTGTQSFAMDGIGLLLVYTDTNGKDIEYWINEGADMLSTMDTSGGLIPEEATAQALFSGAIDLDTVSGAWLWTIVQSGGCTDNMLMFNDCDWTGVYDGTPYSDLDIDERRDVNGCLNTNDHLVQIMAADYPAGGDYLVPSNAFLVVEYEGEVMIHDINVTTDYTGAVNGIKLLKNGAAIPEGQSLTIGEEYTIRSRIVNEGDFDETVNVTIEVANETGAVFLENFDKQINVSDSKDAYRTWNTAGLVPGEYSIMVNASIPEDAHPEDNERTREVTLTSEEITYNVSITAEPDEKTTTRNVNATYTLTISNTGNVADTIELTIPENEADFRSLSADNFTLDAGATATAYLNVKDADAGIYNTTVRATSQGNTSVYDEVTVKTTVTDGPTAVKIPDASGSPGTHVEVPVRIENVMNGPIQGIRLEVDYNESVLDMTSISSIDLTSTWTDIQLGTDGHTMILATDNTGDAIPNGSSGLVVRMNFSVIGSPGDTSPMDLSLIELSNPEGQTGTAPAINGTFTIPKPGVKGRITYICNETGIAGVSINLTNADSVQTTLTNETGYYNFTDVSPDDYVVSATKPRFWDNATDVTVIAGEVTTADMTLCLKGDLNDDGVSADAGDVMRMLKASARDITGDYRYDLNGNGVIADAGDVVLILRASVGDIILW